MEKTEKIEKMEKTDKIEKLICIVCPRGCQLEVKKGAEGEYQVKGHSCPRGKTYGISEVTAPVRMVTSTVRIRGAKAKRCPVKTSCPIPKTQMPEILAALNTVEATAPIAMHQILLTNVAGTKADIIATKAVEAV